MQMKQKILLGKLRIKEEITMEMEMNSKLWHVASA